MAINDSNTWDENKKFILDAIERFEERDKKFDKKIDKLDEKIQDLNMFKWKIIGVSIGISYLLSITTGVIAAIIWINVG